RFRKLLRRRLTSLRCSRHPETSLGKMNILVPIPAISTTLVFPAFRKVWTSVCCGTSSDLVASVYGSCSSVQTPQSRFLHSMLHSKRACDLLMLRDVTPAHKGLSPSGIIWYLRYQMPMLGTHITYTQAGVSC